MADIVKKTRAAKKIPIDYGNGKIYKIVNDANEFIYVGSTTTTLARRFSNHKSRSETHTTTLYTAMKTIGVNHFRIILIENYPCKSKDELEAREYALLNTFDKKLVYNSMFDGKPTAEVKAKMSEAMIGNKNSSFNLGCISFDATNNCRKFQWYENGKQQSKSFSVNKYGDYGAHWRAEQFRRSIYPEYQSTETVAADLMAIDI